MNRYDRHLLILLLTEFGIGLTMNRLLELDPRWLIPALAFVFVIIALVAGLQAEEPVSPLGRSLIALSLTVGTLWSLLLTWPLWAHFLTPFPLVSPCFNHVTPLFSLCYPTDFTSVKEVPPQPGRYGYEFATADGSSALSVTFSLTPADPVTDDQWSALAEREATRLWQQFNPDIDPKVQVVKQSIEPSRHILYMELEAPQTKLHSFYWVAETNGAIAQLFWISPSKEWAGRQSQIETLRQSFTWQPVAVHDWLKP